MNVVNVTPTEDDGFRFESNSTTDDNVWTAPVIQRVTTIAVIMFMALVGNGFIITVLTTTSAKQRSSRVNIFILNLAIGDLCVCAVTMTTEIMFVAFGQWVLGAVMCKIIVYGQIVTLASTTFILTAMTIDRHQAITKPLHFQSESSARRMVALSWLLAFIVAVPQLLIFVEEERRSETGAVKRVCVSQGYTAEWQRKIYVTWLAFYVLVVPTIIISYCYIRIVWTLWHTESTCPTGPNCSRTRTDTISKAKIKTIKMTVCIILGFVTCWTPYFVVTLHDVYTGESLPDVAYVIAETMALFNSAFNPIVYALFSVKRKRSFREVCCCEETTRRHSNFSSSVTPRTDVESFTDGNSSYRFHAVSTKIERPATNRNGENRSSVEMDRLTVPKRSSPRPRLYAETSC
ncbi:neuropeptide S receptor-like [Branchiostoma floridae]|uniref:Neuropeptide S receptor-like n=1 Tax=Branchiostoma floridae TaxID=7739 RepID=A0A9J7MS49_BRAFL|nr:neuropeptide S receptor-like [Branchiostoma floridae]XP_035677752.1 neuropeptide S receptor-like [Branchiostoma floridae]